MGFSQEWEQLYKESRHLSIWPWSDVVRFVMRYIKPGDDFRVLELGVGAGANIPFFENLNAEFCGIDGSPTIVGRLQESYPNLKNSFVVGDFTEDLVFEGPFDLILDRASLTQNSTDGIRRCVSLCFDKLVSGGSFLGVDWFSTKHSAYKQGRQQFSDDIYTRTDFTEGPFAGIGTTHFSDKEHILDLFSAFEVEVMEEKVVSEIISNSGWERQAAFNFLAKKP